MSIVDLCKCDEISYLLHFTYSHMLIKNSLYQSLFGSAITDETNLESIKQKFEMLFGYKRAVFDRLFSNKQFEVERIPGENHDMDDVMNIARDRRDRLTGSMLKELRQTPDDGSRTTERRRQSRRVSQQQTTFPDRRQRIRRSDDLELVLKIAREKCDRVNRPMFQSNQEKLMELRKSGDRRMRLRPGESAKGINFPERRKEIRREEDQEYLESLILWDSEIPIGFRAYFCNVDDDD